MAEVPRGFHAATEHPLKLARGDAFLRRAKQMDGLQPHAQRKVTVLKNSTLAHRKGRATAAVALAQSDLHHAFRVLPAGLRAHTFKATDLLCRRATVRARGTARPELDFNVIEGRFFAEKSGIGKDRVRHDVSA